MLTVASSLAGLGVFGPVGGLAGTILGLLAYFLSPYAVLQIREIRRTESSG